jgi:hypothetical protein
VDAPAQLSQPGPTLTVGLDRCNRPDMDRSFTVLRGYARDHNLRLTDVAQSVVARELPVDRLLQHATSRTDRRTRTRPN